MKKHHSKKYNCQNPTIFLTPRIIFCFLVSLLGFFVSANLYAQPAQENEEKQEQSEPGAPVVLEGNQFKASDGVLLVATFYPGNADKETPSVILLHGKDGSRKDFDKLAVQLAQKGFAVLVPDLRGHGKSTKKQVMDYSHSGGPNAGRGVPRIDDGYKVGDFKKADFAAMIAKDGALWFRYLKYKNNQGELNLNKLIIVGADMGATVGAAWAKADWTGTDRFTKGLVMLTPNAADLKMYLSHKAFKSEIATLIYVGALSEPLKEKALETRNLIVGKPRENAPKEDSLRCPLVELKTESQGVDLLGIKAFEVPQNIEKFINDTFSQLNASDTKWKISKK